MSIYLLGIDKLEREANKLIKEVTSGKTQLLLESAQIIRDEIRDRAPLGPTGNLKKSAYAKAMPDKIGQAASAFAGIRPRTAPHAHLLEFGTSKMRPHPFIRKAIDDKLPEAYKHIEEGLKRIVEAGG